MGAGLHAAGLSAAISSAAAAGLVGENMKFENACSESLNYISSTGTIPHIKIIGLPVISKYVYSKLILN